MFNNFDFDGSCRSYYALFFLETLDVEEVTTMLRENNIEIKESTLKNLFAVVNPKKPSELTLEEFIRFSFDLKANKSIFI